MTPAQHVPAMDAGRALKAFGTQVRDYRRSAGMSQEALAEAVGVSRETISGIERGQKFCTFPLLVKTSEILHVNIEDLFATTPRVRKSPRDVAIDDSVRRVRELLLAGKPLTADDVVELLNTSARISRTKPGAKGSRRSPKHVGRETD